MLALAGKVPLTKSCREPYDLINVRQIRYIHVPWTQIIKKYFSVALENFTVRFELLPGTPDVILLLPA